MNVIKRFKWILILGAVILAGALIVVGLSRTRATNAAETEISETATAFIGDLSESATAAGQVVAQRQATLSLAGSGVVERVHAAVGDIVSQGDLLVELEQENLERRVTSAEVDVAIAQAELADSLAGAAPEEIAAAEAAVRSAQANLDDLLAGPTEQDIAASEAGVRAAEANMAAAAASVEAAAQVNTADILAAEVDLEAALDQQEVARNIWVRVAECEVNESGTHSCVATDNERMETVNQNVAAAEAQVTLAQARLEELRFPDSNNIASAQANLAAATAQFDAAVARHEALLAGASDDQIAAAEADLANARASLARLLAGPSETDITILEIRLAQAETALREAQKALANAALIASFDGLITAVYLNEGELASRQAIELADTTSLEVVLSVDEVDIGNLSLGQQASISLETWPDEEIESEVSAIAPRATQGTGGIVTFDVHLRLGSTSLPVRVGMTANANLVTANREGVLLVPNAAITADRQNGTYSVNVVRTDGDGNRTADPVEVVLGLRDNQYTQIVSGLVEGDEVVIGELSAPVFSFGFGQSDQQ